MEEGLDDIETKDLRWKKIIEDYYGRLRKELDYANEAIPVMEPVVELTGEKCPECGKDLAIKRSRYGQFIGCTGYPDCKFTKTIVRKIDVKCPACGGDIIIKRGKKGKTFYGCSNYPECNQVYWDKPSGKVCPKCGYHFRIAARQRIELTADEGSFEEFDKDMSSTNIIDFPDYTRKLKNAKLNSGENESVITDIDSAYIFPLH